MNDSRLVERAVRAHKAAGAPEPLFDLDDGPAAAPRPSLIRPRLRNAPHAEVGVGAEERTARIGPAPGPAAAPDADLAAGETPAAQARFGVAVEETAVMAGEAIELLKANLWLRCAPDGPRSVLVVGAERGSGASTVAWDLAAGIAQDGDGAVLLVDAGGGAAHRHPRWAGAAAQGARSGITLERLLAAPATGAADRDASAAALYALPAAGSPGERRALRSHAFDHFVARARAGFRTVVIDAPGISGHPETLVLAGKVDGVILVLESERTTRQRARWVAAQIDAAGGSVLGVVLNRRRHRIPSWLYGRM